MRHPGADAHLFQPDRPACPCRRARCGGRALRTRSDDRAGSGGPPRCPPAAPVAAPQRRARRWPSLRERPPHAEETRTASAGDRPCTPLGSTGVSATILAAAERPVPGQLSGTGGVPEPAAPEVGHNPTFFVGEPDGSRNRDPRTATIDAWRNRSSTSRSLAPSPWVLWPSCGWCGRYRLPPLAAVTRFQTDAHTKLLDRLTSN